MNVNMNWRRPSGYMVQLYKYQGTYIAHHVASLHILLALMELDDFRYTLKYLYKWHQHLIKISRQIKLALFSIKRRYETIDISGPQLLLPAVSVVPSLLLLPPLIFSTHPQIVTKDLKVFF